MATLSQWRREAGLTQKQLADALGVSLGALVKYERGERMPRRKIVPRIVEVTKGSVTQDDLYRTASAWASRREPDQAEGAQAAASLSPESAAPDGEG